MTKVHLQDITSQVIYDDLNYDYSLKSDYDQLSHFHKSLLDNKINNDNKIMLPSIGDIVTECYPFIEKHNKNIVRDLINRNKKINSLVFNAINNKRGMELNFDPMDEKDKFIISLAKSLLFDINKFIYKYEISNLYSNLVFINDDVNLPYIGNIDVIAQGTNGWYICTFKMSRSGYSQKYFAELYLQKQLFENNTKFKVKECFVFNPRDERVIISAKQISNGEIFKINNFIAKWANN